MKTTLMVMKENRMRRMHTILTKRLTNMMISVQARLARRIRRGGPLRPPIHLLKGLSKAAKKLAKIKIR